MQVIPYIRAAATKDQREHISPTENQRPHVDHDVSGSTSNLLRSPQVSVDEEITQYFVNEQYAVCYNVK